MDTIHIFPMGAILPEEKSEEKSKEEFRRRMRV